MSQKHSSLNIWPRLDRSRNVRFFATIISLYFSVASSSCLLSFLFLRKLYGQKSLRQLFAFTNPLLYYFFRALTLIASFSSSPKSKFFSSSSSPASPSSSPFSSPPPFSPSSALFLLPSVFSSLFAFLPFDDQLHTRKCLQTTSRIVWPCLGKVRC